MADKITENTTYRVLLIEDDKLDQMAFERLVKQQELPYDYKIAGSFAQARSILESNKFDIIIVDYSTPGRPKPEQIAMLLLPRTVAGGLFLLPLRLFAKMTGLLLALFAYCAMSLASAKLTV